MGYREALTPKVSLPMVWIPPGRFWMGSPPEETDRSDDEGPQHSVQLQGFFLGQTPVTQAQWEAVARWKPKPGEPPFARRLDPKPSKFPGPDRPVERVSWEDAMEFCLRISHRFKQSYTLPSEAEWEYACRAGTTTPFHFGTTLSTELANYDGNYVYGDGVKGIYRAQTTDVASFPANAWGLHDMHGTVWEWCADDWHASYEGAPEDGRAWLDEPSMNDVEDPDPMSQPEGLRRNEIMRRNDLRGSTRRSKLLRGGSWSGNPRDCRSAYRNSGSPVGRGDHVGFRVCCLPQDAILYT
ncbi:MAG: formylglycine-generating enzyme family protein [Cyanobacteriota bacterium]